MDFRPRQNSLSIIYVCDCFCCICCLVRVTNSHCVCARKHQSHKRTENRHGDAPKFRCHPICLSIFLLSLSHIIHSARERFLSHISLSGSSKLLDLIDSDVEIFAVTIVVRSFVRFRSSARMCMFVRRLYVLISINFPGCRHITSILFRPATTRFSLVLLELN